MQMRSVQGRRMESAPRVAARVLVMALSIATSARGQASHELERRTAPGSVMRYVVSLPKNWSATRRWPVIVVITDAYRHFDEATQTFARARGDRPFVIVTPLVLSGGGVAQQHKADFDYAEDAWGRAASLGNCAFDEEGLAAVLDDVKRRYSTEDGVFLTGWEAGGHVVWAASFLHPERLRGVALATPNFNGRCVEDGRASSDPSRATLPIRVFHGTADPTWAAGQPLFDQSQRAMARARAAGYARLAESAAPERPHGPLADEILAYFASLLTASSP